MFTGFLKSIGRTGIFTALALVLGGLGVVASRMNQAPPPPPAAPKLFDVPVASTDLQAGRTITKSDFFIQKMTVEQKKAAGFVDTHFSAGRDLIDRIVRQPRKKGQYFTLECLYPEGTGPSISEKLRPGMRAVVISVEPASVTNLTTPDSFVDVLFHPSSVNRGSSAGVTKLVGGRILERIEVMAVDLSWYSQTLAATKPDPGRGASVTLAVTVQQAEVLKSLESVGRFSLIAVPSSAPPADEPLPNPERMKQILGNGDPVPPPLRLPQIEIVRGGVISKVVLDTTIRPSCAGGYNWRTHLPGPVPMNVPSYPSDQIPQFDSPGAPRPTQPYPAGPSFPPEPVPHVLPPPAPAPVSTVPTSMHRATPAPFNRPVSTRFAALNSRPASSQFSGIRGQATRVQNHPPYNEQLIAPRQWISSAVTHKASRVSTSPGRGEQPIQHGELTPHARLVPTDPARRNARTGKPSTPTGAALVATSVESWADRSAHQASSSFKATRGH